MARTFGKSGDYAVGYGKPPAHTQFKKGVRRTRKRRVKEPEGLMEIFKRVCSEKVRAREGNRERVITTSEAVVLANRNLALKQKANGLRNLSLLMDRHQQTIDPARVGGRGLVYEAVDNKTPEQHQMWADAYNEQNRVRCELNDLKAKYGLSDHPWYKARYKNPPGS